MRANGLYRISRKDGRRVRVTSIAPPEFLSNFYPYICNGYLAANGTLCTRPGKHFVDVPHT